MTPTEFTISIALWFGFSFLVGWRYHVLKTQHFIARRLSVKPAHTAGGPVGEGKTMETRPPRTPIEPIAHRDHSPFVPLSMFEEADCAELDEAVLMAELDNS